MKDANLSSSKQTIDPLGTTNNKHSMISCQPFVLSALLLASPAFAGSKASKAKEGKTKAGKKTKGPDMDKPYTIQLLSECEIQAMNGLDGNDCWVVLEGFVYDATGHPGPLSAFPDATGQGTVNFCGQVLNDSYQYFHNAFPALGPKGYYAPQANMVGSDGPMCGMPAISQAELAMHNTPDDCWEAHKGYVLDLSNSPYESDACGGVDDSLAVEILPWVGVIDWYAERCPCSA